MAATEGAKGKEYTDETGVTMEWDAERGAYFPQVSRRSESDERRKRERGREREKESEECACVTVCVLVCACVCVCEAYNT